MVIVKWVGNSLPPFSITQFRSSIRNTVGGRQKFYHFVEAVEASSEVERVVRPALVGRVRAGVQLFSGHVLGLLCGRNLHDREVHCRSLLL